MAFEVPLEADRVGDLNFFNIVLRAPVIGTIFWILGGNRAKEESEEEDHLRQELEAASDSEQTMKRSFSKRSALKKTAPSLVGSEISDIRESMDGLSLGSESKGLGNRKRLSWSDESGQKLCEIIDEVRDLQRLCV